MAGDYSQALSTDNELHNREDPWDPTTWAGDVDELRRRLMGLSIPHDLKCEIHEILQQAAPDRHAELLTFLVNTASQLTFAEREMLVQANLSNEHNSATRQLLQKYQIARAVLQQWKSTVQPAHKDDAMRDSIGDGKVEDEASSAYAPSSEGSQSSTQSDVILRRQKHPPPKALASTVYRVPRWIGWAVSEALSRKGPHYEIW